MNYRFVIGKSWNVFRKLVIQEFNHDPGEQGGRNGRTMWLEHSDKKADLVLVWVEKKDDLKTIAHECYHAATRTLMLRGILADWNNDEVCAYLLSELIEAAT